MASRRNNSFKSNQKKLTDSPKFYSTEQDDTEDIGFDADTNPINPFSSTQQNQSSSKWFNESWRKIQQIMDNNKDKQTQSNKKENISQELLSFSNDDHVDNLLTDYLDYPITLQEGEEIQEGDISYVSNDFSDLSTENNDLATTKNIIKKSSSNNSLPLESSGNLNNLTTTNSTINNINNSTFYTTTNLSITTNTVTSTHQQPQQITPSSSSSNINQKTNSDNNKKDETTHIKTNHTFLFSKIKKNCSMEQLNELNEDKDDKELINDKRNKDDLLKLNNNNNENINISCSSSNSSHTSNSSGNKIKTPQVQFRQKITTINKTPQKSSTIKNSSSKQMNKLKEELNQSDSSFDIFNTTDSSTDFLKTIQLERIKKESKNQKLNLFHHDEPIPSLNYFLSFVINLFRKHFNFFWFTTSLASFFILTFAIQLSPFSSFANGLLIGITFSFLSLILIVIYALNLLFQRIDYENDLHERIISGDRWKKYPAYKKTQKIQDEKLLNSLQQQQNEIHEGWFFELVYSKKLGVDRLTPNEKTDYDKMPETKLQLTYIKLEGTIIRLYVPKADQSKKLKPDIEKNDFLKVSNKMNQHIYDFSKMNTRKLKLWLPKNIRNRKKYLWHKKYPFILIIEETNKLSNENKRLPFNLILFARTNREKEQWYNKFKTSIEMAEQNLSIHHLTTTAASTPEEVTHENESENMPRAKSLDINLSCEFEHLTNFLNYDTFIQDLLGSNVNLQNISNNSNNSDQQNSKNLYWFNAMVGRVFFDFLTHKHWTRYTQLKIQRKLSRVKLPYFIQQIKLTNVNLGSSMPKFLAVNNSPIIDDKGIWIDFDLDYQGCFSMTLETKLDLMKLKETKAIERELKPIKSPVANQSTTAFEYDDLSDPESIVSLSDDESEENLSIESDVRQAKLMKFLDRVVVSKYFQQVSDTKYVKKKMEDISNLPILLTVNIFRLKGVLTINLPPSPTDRLWYGFREVNEFEIECKPSLGERTVSLAPITQILSKKLKQLFYKELVLPNLDDIVLGNIMMGNEDIDIVDEVP